MSLNTARFRRCGIALALIVAVCVVSVGFAPSNEKKPVDPPAIDAKALAVMVQHFDKVEKQEHPWGWIRWMMNDKLDPNSKMTFGLVQINAGQKNPLHIHPNCEEHLYVLSGSCQHQLGRHVVTLKEGDVIRIPQGVSHKAWTEKEAMQAIIVYSSGDRQFEVVEQ